jgi:hypothetical protein
MVFDSWSKFKVIYSENENILTTQLMFKDFN